MTIQGLSGALKDGSITESLTIFGTVPSTDQYYPVTSFGYRILGKRRNAEETRPAGRTLEAVFLDPDGQAVLPVEVGGKIRGGVRT